MKAAVLSRKRTVPLEFVCPKCSQSFGKPIQMIGHCWSTHKLRVKGDGTIVRGKHSKKATSSKNLEQCPVCLEKFHGLGIHMASAHKQAAMEKELKRLQTELARMNPSAAAQPVEPSEPVTPMLIKCCEECGHDVRSQNDLRVMAEMADRRGKKLKMSIVG